MQYHLNGVRTGDPGLVDAAKVDEAESHVDVLIVGCGPAGLTLATQLSAFPDISVAIVDRKSGPLEYGQADGIACRSMEMFRAFGFAERVAKEAYQVNEVTFWRPSVGGAEIRRVERIRDVEDDVSEMPHVILSQARVHEFFLEAMARSARRLEPRYNRELIRLKRGCRDGDPVEAGLACLDRGDRSETVFARYVVGCDGARSTVRKCMGLELKGESAQQLWGVMDVLCTTDFPDIRFKCAIQSPDRGSLLIIPREGGYLVRLYIELDALREGERAADRGVTAEALIERARTIFSPYSLEIKEIAWWSAYEIGQRVCDRFDDRSDGRHPRIFIAGDACHTHSPKAGQGMNVSMADAFNLGWKLAAVLRGQAAADLLYTYSDERRAQAQELIEFDREMARLFSERSASAENANRFQRYFSKHQRYTAGVETRYEPSLITLGDSQQELALGLVVGMRFHSAPVVRAADGRLMELGDCLDADGRWRLIAFAPHGDSGTGAVWNLCSFLQSGGSGDPLCLAGQDEDPDSVIDFRAVFQLPHRKLKLDEMPELLLPRKGRYGLIDYEKVFCADHGSGPDIFEMRGIDRTRGALVIIRPDHFVAAVLAVGSTEKLTGFFVEVFGTQHDKRTAAAGYGTGHAGTRLP